MCNCGNKRTELYGQSVAGQPGREPVKTPAQKMWPDVHFVYTGQSALTVSGTVTGKTYRFNATGEKQAVDYRDASSFTRVPVLKRVQ